MKILEALCIATLEEVDNILPYSNLIKHSNTANIEAKTKEFFEDKENIFYKHLPGAYFALKVLIDQDKLEKCIEFIPDFLTLLKSAKVAMEFLNPSSSINFDQILNTYSINEEEHSGHVENIEVIPELGGVVKEFDENIEG